MSAFPQRRTIAVLAGVQVLGGLGNGAALAVGSLAVRDISGSSGWAGLATVAITLGAAATTVPLASLALRAGRRPALAAGWLIGAVGAVVSVLAISVSSTLGLLMGLAAMGASTAANLQSRFAATDRADPTAVGRAVALVTWATTIGAVLGPNTTGPTGSVAVALGMAPLAGPFMSATLSFVAAAATNLMLLRPDPLAGPAAGGVDGQNDRATAAGAESSLAAERASVDDADALTALAPPEVRPAGLERLTGPARLAVIVSACAHAMMVGVMSLTPVHLADHGAGLQLIGLTISLHIAGMYALAPVFGWLVDGWGYASSIVAGQVLLIGAVALAGTGGDSHVQVGAGLILLGLGWSLSTIAGAALLSASVAAGARPRLQGRNDLIMSLSGAGGGVLAGVIVAWQGYGMLNAAAALLVVPVAVALRHNRGALSAMRR